MILKACLLLMVSVAWEVAGVSISNVYMSTGAGANLEYLKYPSSYNYEYPSSYPSSQIAQYSLAPVSYESYPVGQSYAYRTYPEQTIALSQAAIPQAAPSANYVAYGTPSTVPYVYGRNDPATSYSYVLVNEGAGQELKLSDGEVIRGGYPFYQPQGLIQYVANDNQGLNAILKAYIPNEPVTLTETVHHESVHHAEPCNEAKSEALTAHESLEESHEDLHGGQERHASHEEHDASHELHHDSSEEHHESHEGHHESHEARHGSHEEVHEFVLHDSGHKERIIVISEREGDVELESEEHHESGHESHDHHESEHESRENHDSEHESHEHHESEHESHGQHESDHESHEQGSHEHESHEREENEEPTHEHHDGHHTHEAIVEASHEPHASNELHEVHVIPQVPTLGLPVPNNVYIPYNDFIKCIEAAMVKGNTHPLYAPVPKPISPLTYLVFNKPC